MNKEKQFINIIKEIFNNSLNKKILIDIGDDCAYISNNGNQVITTDAIIEDTHFNLDTFSLEDIGWKSIAINQSDICSMGASPEYYNITLGLPSYFNEVQFRRIINGIKLATDQFGGTLIGGDIIKSEKILISITAIGYLSSSKPPMTRSKAIPGENIGVTGNLGNSLAFRMIKESKFSNNFSEFHLRPKPKVSEGIYLYQNGIDCCMDISDGLLEDLSKLCEASKVSATVNIDHIPKNSKLKKMFPVESDDIALIGGEDYELLFTFKSLPVEFLNKISIIGKIENSDAKGSVKFIKNGSNYLPKIKPWTHFS